MSAAARPHVLVATTNFPLARRGDRTGNFIVDAVTALTGEVDQTVVMPNDDATGAPREVWEGVVPVVRFQYWWPRRHMRLAHGDGIPTNLARSWLARLQLPALIVMFAWTLWRCARNADVIHAHWLPVALLALPARWRSGAPLVVTLHGTDVTQFPRWFVRWALRRVDVVVSAHDDLLRRAAGLAPGVRRERIRHYVVPQRDHRDDPDAAALDRDGGPGRLVLFVGRLSPERDPLTLVRAAPGVLAALPDTTFAIVGDGPLLPQVEAEIARLGVRAQVEAFGYRRDVWSFLDRADVFTALSDRNNAWVTAMVEAMRAGVPVVATTAGETATALTDGEDALLIPVGDHEALASALVEVLSDDTLAARLRNGARRTLARAGFDPGTVLAELTSLYRELAGGQRARR